MSSSSSTPKSLAFLTALPTSEMLVKNDEASPSEPSSSNWSVAAFISVITSVFSAILLAISSSEIPESFAFCTILPASPILVKRLAALAVSVVSV